MKNLTVLAIILFIISCESPKKQEQTVVNETQDKTIESTDYPDLLDKFLDAHGGLDRWKSYGTLSYDLQGTLGREKQEHHIVDLNSRKVLIENDSFNIGMNGEQVWITPDKATFGKMSPRFYHNLFFYFFSLPYVLADAGAIYEDMGEQNIDGKNYRALKVSFEQGVGDASDDFYIAHLNPETYQLEVLLYTVTYFSGEKTQKFNSLLYKEWQDVDGLLVPAYMEGHKFEDGKVGDLRYSSTFSNVSFNTDSPDQAMFEIPEGGVIDSLIVH